MSDVQMVRDEVQNRTDGVIACIPEAIKRLKKRKGIKEPKNLVKARFKNRYDQPTPYEENGTTGPIESQAPLTQPAFESCGNQRYAHGRWTCLGCCRPAGRCLVCLQSAIRQRRRDLDGESFITKRAMDIRKRGAFHPGASRGAPLYDEHKPIVLQCDSRPIICRNERQVKWELDQRGLRSVRGPGQDA